MSHKTFLLLLASGLLAWSALSSGTVLEPVELEATQSPYLVDNDGDLLPDVVEWAVLSHRSSPDGDNDGVEDFVEVVQFGDPIVPGQPQAQDHEARTVVTIERRPGGPDVLWCHFLFRLMGGGPDVVPVALHPWIEVRGTRLPFGLAINSPAVQIQQYSHATEGHWAILSAELGDAASLRSLGAVVFGADATIGTTQLRVGTYGTVTPSGRFVHFVPRPGAFALQSSTSQQDELDPFFRSNKLCVLDLELVGHSPVGSVFETRNSRCEEAAGLDCSAQCPQSEGWTVTLPDGLGPLTGQ